MSPPLGPAAPATHIFNCARRRSSIEISPASNTRDAHFRKARQYRERCAAQQKRCFLPPSTRNLNGQPHQIHVASASVLIAPRPVQHPRRSYVSGSVACRQAVLRLHRAIILPAARDRAAPLGGRAHLFLAWSKPAAHQGFREPSRDLTTFATPASIQLALRRLARA